MHKLFQIINAFCLVFLLIIPSISAAKSFTDNKPSAEKQKFCETLVRKHGYRSYHLNDNYYGKGVGRPIASKWHLVRVKEPWMFSSELFYVYEQTTDDDFIHTAYCKWQKDGYLEMYVEQFEYGGLLMCSTFGEDDMGC